MWGGSVADAAGAFASLCAHAEPGWAPGRALDEMGWRYAFLPARWRAWACGLDEPRLRELLLGNLACDDSGVDGRYEKERQALRVLCVLRVFKEHSLSMADPDPRINSLRRIKLGEWKEFPEVAAPGLERGAMEAALRRASLGGAMDVFGSQALRSCPRKAMVQGVLLGAACAAVAAAATGALIPAGPAALLAWALGGAAGCNQWTLGWLRRRSCQGAGERLLGWLECGPSSRFERLALEGLGSAARASGEGGAMALAADPASAMEDWAKMEGELRKRINAERARGARESLLSVGAAVAMDEREVLARELGGERGPAPKTRGRI